MTMDPSPGASPNPASPSAPAESIRRSDPRQRRNIYALLAAMAMFAIVLFTIGLPALKRWTEAGDIDAVLRKMALVFDGLSALMLGAALYALDFARRIFRSGEFPPPQTWVLRDTPIKRDDAARARGWWVVACAACFLLLAAYVIVLPGRLRGLMAPAGAISAHPAFVHARAPR